MERDASTSAALDSTSSITAGGLSGASIQEQLSKQITNPGTGGNSGTFAQLTANPFFTAGFGLAALGVALRWGAKGLQHGSALLRRRLLVDVEITRHDDSYQWFLQWMTTYTRSQMENLSSNGLASTILRKLTPGVHHLSMQTTQLTLPNGAAKTQFTLVPGPGMHILRYKKAFIAVTRERELKNTDLRTGQPFETIKLTTLYAHRQMFESLFTEAHALSIQAQEGKTKIFTSWGPEWKEFGQPKRKRPLSSVILADGIKERIVDDVRTFLGARNWYLDRGIPYRRGYLLYGPPGTGKSSFIQALAGELDFNIAMLHLSERGLTDDRLNHLLSNVPQRTIVLLEDADAAFSNRTQSDEHGYKGATVTFSGLLNALDGVASAEERIVFMTTNHVEQMDAALVRPGRVDMTVHLGDATDSQVRQLWDRFYSDQDANSSSCEAFMKQLKDLGMRGRLSTAALQGIFLFHKSDPQGAIKAVSEILSQQQITQGGNAQ